MFLMACRLCLVCNVCMYDHLQYLSLSFFIFRCIKRLCYRLSEIQIYLNLSLCFVDFDILKVFSKACSLAGYI